MALKNKFITFYHIATDTNDFKSFFREGTKTTLSNANIKGFYVWSNKTLAKNHIHLLNSGFLNKSLSQHEALILGISVPKESLKYPIWQIDVEYAMGLFELFDQYDNFINQNLKNLNITLHNNELFLKKICEISCQKEEDKTIFQFKGKTSFNSDFPLVLTHYKNYSPIHPASEAVLWQTLVDVLCNTNPQFKEDYSQLMQTTYQKGNAFKYTGKKPLTITSAIHVSVDEKDHLKQTVLWDKEKGSQQVCPFLKLKNLQR